MKRLISSGVLLAIVSLCAAQTETPEFGALTVNEKALTECNFDKEADAVVLIDEGLANHNDEYNLITTRRTRIKILKPNGVKYANVVIHYYSKDDFQYISNIEAWSWSPENGGAEGIKKLPNSSIYRQKVNDRYSVVKFALPDVKPGSVIEYKYTNTSKNYNGLEDWYFHRDLPVLHSCFTLYVPPRFEFAYRVHKSDALPIVIKNSKGSGEVYFEMNNIPGLRDEPYMDAEKDYLQRVEFQLSGYQGTFGGNTHYMTNWEEVTRTLMADKDFGLQLNKNISGSENMVNNVKLLEAPFDRMEAIYHYVQKNIEWNGYKSFYAIDGVKEAWEKKKGTTGQVNLLLINLLKEAGLEVYPLLVSERGHGKVNADYPFLDQFNNVLAYVLIGDKRYVLDGAGPYTPPFLIPFSVINTKAFLVNRKKGGIISLAETEKTDKNLVIIHAKIDENGAITGQASIQSSDYARLNRIRSWYRDKNKFRDNYIMAYQPGLQIDSLVMKNLENDSLALEQQFHFTIPPNENGGYKLVNLNLFSGITKNPFISDIRFTNIDYGCLQQYTVIQDIELPSTLKIESLPKNLRMIMPDTSISMTRYMDVNNNALTVRYSIQTKRSVFTADEYDYVKDFYKKMADIMNEQLVLHKKD
jgi:hypothetical protein